MVAQEPAFARIWIVLCGAKCPTGDPIVPAFIAVLDLRSGNEIHIGMPKLAERQNASFPTDSQTLVVAYGVVDLLAVHIALGWRPPERVIDLAVEFRNITNGLKVAGGHTLAGALIWFGLPASPAVAFSSHPRYALQRLHIIAGLFQRMRASLDWGRALLRGRYLVAVARIQENGVPVDVPGLKRMSQYWAAIFPRIVEEVDAVFGVYNKEYFQAAGFEQWLATHGIPWPRTPALKLDLSDGIFREQSRAYPELRPLNELRTTLARFQPDITLVGQDGRNRAPLRPFASRTGRNQPRSKAWLLGAPSWVRNLIRPEAGTGLALVDWSQQEFGIAAALSDDSAMQAAYKSGDPYLAFAMVAGAIPTGATEELQRHVRDQYKACALGVLYGMGPARLGRMLGVDEIEADGLLRRHRAAYPQFWRWSDNVEAYALLHEKLQSVFGWRIAVAADANPRFLRNFPMQANGAEMLRLACCLTTEAGIRVGAPLHDALLIEAGLSDLDAAVAETQRLMAEASSIVLDGFELRSDVRVVRYPDRLGDDRGSAIWPIVEKLIEEGRA